MTTSKNNFLHPDFRTMLAKLGTTVSAFARSAGVADITIRVLLTPENQPARNFKGAREVTIWKVANAYANLSGLTPDEARDLLFISKEDFDRLRAVAE